MGARRNTGERVLSTEPGGRLACVASIDPARTDLSHPRSVALAKPNFEYQKRQKELEKKRKKEEKLKRRQERHAVPADGEAPAAAPPAEDGDPA